MHNIALGQNFVPNRSHWRFPEHRTSIANQGTNNLNSVPLNIKADSSPSAPNIPLRIHQISVLLIDTQSPFSIRQKNLITTAINVVLGIANPVFQPTCPYVGPTPLSWMVRRCLQLPQRYQTMRQWSGNWLMQ